MNKIHPLALVDSQAVLGQDVEIGPFSVIEAGVVLGDRCKIASRVAIKEGTVLGTDNEVSEGTTLGGRAQHLANNGAGGKLIIGNGNRIRENITIHRGYEPTSATIIGNDNLIMVNTHIAHDCHIGNNVVMVNNVMLAGHVQVQDRAYFGGGAGIHQHVRVGQFAMVGGLARVTRDIPPYVLVDGEGTEVVGLNKVGLKRNGFTPADIQQLMAAYRVIYRAGLRWVEVLEKLQADFSTGPAAQFGEFFQNSKRGFIQERRISRKATLKLVKYQDEDENKSREAA